MRWYAIMTLLILSVVTVPVFAQTPLQFTITQNGQAFIVKYDVSGAIVDDISINPMDTSLIVSLKSTSDGSLTITLPRALIDANVTTGDDKFLVLVDGADSDFTENQTNVDRTITVAIPEGTTQVEVIGTQIVPEFGGLSAAVLLVAVFSIIVLSTKTRLKF